MLNLKKGGDLLSITTTARNLTRASDRRIGA
jgi:hypothetical protein